MVGEPRPAAGAMRKAKGTRAEGRDARASIRRETQRWPAGWGDGALGKRARDGHAANAGCARGGKWAGAGAGTRCRPRVAAADKWRLDLSIDTQNAACVFGAGLAATC